MTISSLPAPAQTPVEPLGGVMRDLAELISLKLVDAHPGCTLPEQGSAKIRELESSLAACPADYRRVLGILAGTAACSPVEHATGWRILTLAVMFNSNRQLSAFKMAPLISGDTRMIGTLVVRKGPRVRMSFSILSLLETPPHVLSV